MLRPKPAALVALAVAATAWFAYLQLVRDSGARPFAFRDLTRRLHVRPNAMFARRFRDAAALADYVRRNGTLPSPRIDFSRDEAVLVSAGPRSSTGYRIEIRKAAEDRGRIVFVVRERAPTLHDPGRPRLTYPYRLLVFRRTDKPVEVQWQGRP